MEFGAVFPTSEIGNDMIAIRDWTRTAEDLGYSRIIVYDHVVGPSHKGRENERDIVQYDELCPWHEPLTLLSYMAALTTRIQLMTGVLALGQRQAVLVAKQAAEIDILSGGRFILGVGSGNLPWEFEALGMSYPERYRRMEEQVTVMRQLWAQPLVDFSGAFHRVDQVAMLPRPRSGTIPVWLGGQSEAMMRRAGRIADGFIFATDGPKTIPLAGTLLDAVASQGRDAQAFPMDTITHYSLGPRHWHANVDAWRAVGGRCYSLRTTDSSSRIHGYPPNGFTSPLQHIQALEQFAWEMGIARGSSAGKDQNP